MSILCVGHAEEAYSQQAYLGAGDDPGSVTPRVALAPDLQPVSHSQVCRFIASVLRQLLSYDLAGSEENLAVIVRSASSSRCH